MTAKRNVVRAFFLVISLTLIGGWFPTSSVQAQQGPTNLLVNGGFEWWDLDAKVWPFQDGIPEVQVCPSWRAFYLDNPPSYAKEPHFWRRPEFRDVKAGEYSTRVRSGNLAAKYFSFAGQHEAGFYQQVSGIAPETPLRFSAYMHTWSCMPMQGTWNICPVLGQSYEPAPMHTRVGIDPTGGTNPWSSSVVWSLEIDAYDVWTYFQVEAVAQNSTVTVFTYSRADWTDTWFRVHNDVYVDDASLISLNEVLPTATPDPAILAETPESAAPTETPDPTQPTATPAPTTTPAATSTPRPDGAIIHVVQDGDTLSVIARQYRASVETLQQLNALTDANVILAGQELVISVPESTPTATPLPELPSPTPLPPTPTPMEIPSLSTASLTTPTAIPTPEAPLPAVTTEVVVPLPIPVATPAAENSTKPWGFVGGVGLALFFGVGVGFHFGRKR
ncbi:MAG: LysM peptidoglycan-binding domain-containing protein [Anaerolineae bacterium]|nr:LysM peptidoglycan-binding domain-containing protein [Anaerolineae bacterium]